MPVIYGNGHFGLVAYLIGNNDFLLTLCRRQYELSVCIKCYGRSVHRNRNCLCDAKHGFCSAEEKFAELAAKF